jgi:hypothetical protein
MGNSTLCCVRDRLLNGHTLCRRSICELTGVHRMYDMFRWEI